MSARQRLVAALVQYRPGGRLATLADVEHAEQLVDAYRAEVLAEGFPPLWVADYDSAPLTLHLTNEAARAACDDVAKVDANGRSWDWVTGDSMDIQFWCHPDDDRPTGYTGGTVWQITVEHEEKDTRGAAPQQGESTPPPAPRPCALPDERFTRARRMARIAGFFRAARTGRDTTAGVQ
ncbi:hypothetical protein [Streptomyces sp. C1-2]|uniref:hypothetical protein n=1 Tax=Streptomyces sp. C1-2 TaxID=2720022 RepID=UPI0014326D0A|nr:hypothetical protein [Streptomyces sp. C1-2]NJP71934.1 hypothetical protein [Streptomyces sp. C1-2]